MKYKIDRSHNSKKVTMNNPLTPEQESEARYPPLTEGQREVAKNVMNLNFKERAKRVGWNDDKSEQSKLIFAAFIVAASEQSLIWLYKFEEQSKKDKERIKKLIEEVSDLKHERDHLNFIIKNSTITKPTP